MIQANSLFFKVKPDCKSYIYIDKYSEFKDTFIFYLFNEHLNIEIK